MLIHTVTYTIPTNDARLEQTTHIERSSKLTHEGCQRILRREGISGAIVERVEVMHRA